MDKEIIRTPLENWLRLAPDHYIEQVAAVANTTTGYLRILAKANHREPGVGLAVKISRACNDLRQPAEDLYGINLPMVPVESLAKRGS